jgi:hypothetical protein
MQETNVTTKRIKRTPRDRVKAEVVKWLANKYQVAQNTVYYILRGEFNSPIAQDVLRDYNQKYSQLKKVLEA